MGILGIAPNGELVTTEEDTVAKRIEIRCDDPRFLELAARKRPNAVTQFIGGTGSYMRDWGVGVNYCLMALGIYGSENQQRAKLWANLGVDLIEFAFKNPELAYKLISLKLRYTYSNAAFSGRLAGSAIINTLMLTGGRYGRAVMSGRTFVFSKAFSRATPLRPSNYKNGAMRKNAPVMGANFILALTGSAVLTIKNGNADIASLFAAFLTGEFEEDPIGSTYKALFQEAQSLSMTIPPSELEAMLAILEAVETCLKSPGEFGNPGREPIETHPHVPVGTVSSARPPGVMGTIEAGTETNALDVISEQNLLNSYGWTP